MCVKDVWTTQPCNSSRQWPFLSHPAISLCIAVICHGSSYGLAEVCVYVCVYWYASDWIWNHNSVTVSMHVFVVKLLRLPIFFPHQLLFSEIIKNVITWMVTSIILVNDEWIPNWKLIKTVLCVVELFNFCRITDGGFWGLLEKGKCVYVHIYKQLCYIEGCSI